MNKQKHDLSKTGVFERHLIDWIRILLRSKRGSIAHGGFLWTAIGGLIWFGNSISSKIDQLNSIPEIQEKLTHMSDNKCNYIMPSDLYKIAQYCKTYKVNFHNLTELQFKLILDH